MADNKGDIFVEADFDNIFSIDPNKIYDEFGNVQQRLVNHEELVMYANLECNILPRTKLQLGVGAEEKGTNVVIATTKINFMNPGNKNFLDTSWVDNFTPQTILNGDNLKNAKNGPTNSPTQNESYEKNQSFILAGDQTDATALLGITGIQYKINASLLPTCTITLEDVRGRALFELGDQSPYAVFFNMPYPVFYLTMKGFYGKALKVPLSLQNFNASFNTNSGNFQITLSFYGYKYTMLSEIPNQALIALPNMYERKYTFKPKDNPDAPTSEVKQETTTRGREILNNTYSKYIAKGLIKESLPKYTIIEFVNKLQKIDKDLAKLVSEVDFSRLTDIKLYGETLKLLNQELITFKGGTTNSWYNTYARKKDPSDLYYYVKNKDATSQIIVNAYINKDSKKPFEVMDESKTELTKILTKFEKKILGIVTFQDLGFGIIQNDFYLDNTITNVNDFDLKKSFEVNGGTTGIESPEFLAFTDTLKSLLSSYNDTLTLNTTGSDRKITYFINLDKYKTKFSNLEKKYLERKEKIEIEIADDIRKKFQDTNLLGFDPTIRNVTAILFANCEAFISLMDEVHTKSWDVRNDPDRKKLLNNAITDKLDTSTSPVYPWPQVLEVKDNGEQQQYSLKYPGDYLDGRNSSIWPEVEFVEEFIKGQIQRTNLINTPSQTDKNQLTEPGMVSISVLDLPISNIIYLNKDEVKFFYEIWERCFVLSHYGRISKTNDGSLYKAIADFEANNLIQGLEGTSNSLKKKLVDYRFDSKNIIATLRNISNGGLGTSWQLLIREQYNTQYIQSNLQQSNGIYGFTQINKPTSFTSETEFNFSNFVSNTRTNSQDFFDIYPFGITNWLRSNLSNGSSTSINSANNTTTLNYNKDLKFITNFKEDEIENKITNLPVVNYNYLEDYSKQFEYRMDLKEIYETRTPKNFLPTEGYLRYSASTGLLTSELIQKSTSIMNTPMFINSILTANYKFRNNNKTPYVVPAYLFLNSLPLATLREKNKSFANNSVTDLDYIFATFKKFGAVHKVPYAWILKYGSIWYRYKYWLETGNDILTNDWSNFQYKPNYDPITFDSNKTYSLNVPQPNGSVSATSIVLDTIVNTSSGIQASTMNLGFYPNLIDEFNYCYQGLELIGSTNGYTDSSINNVLGNKLKLIQSDGETNATPVINPIYRTRGFDSNNSNRTLSITTWSALAYKFSSETQTKQCYILPSFGTEMNEAIWECFKEKNTKPYYKIENEISGNQAVFNGSARLVWNSPNYGYFELSGLTKPSPSEYMKEIFSGTSEQTNFGLQSSNYTNISEIFSTFDKIILDLFESEFLKFSTSIYDADDNTIENFQSLFRSMMLIDEPQGNSFQTLLRDAITKQENKLFGVIEDFIKYEKFIKIGNPSSFDRKIFYSFAGLSSADPIIQSPIEPYLYQPYQQNLPPDVSFASSVLNQPTAWRTLQLYVGFSDLPNLTYGGQSYITDFFRDMNVEFSENNIKNLYQLIKIYATQKIIDPTLNRDKFIILLNENLEKVNQFKDGIIDQVFQNSKLIETLKDQILLDSNPNEIDTSEVENKTIKIELWELFKAINDKWIAGGDFETKTFFEDVMFLDRTSKDIGDDIIVDIFKVKTILEGTFKNAEKYVDENFKTISSIQHIIMSIIQDANFVVWPIAGYVNYFGIQTPIKNAQPRVDDPMDLANSLFGTFLNVDTRNSSPKLVCFYANKPSDNLSIEKPEQGYKNDSWNFSTPVNNPIRYTPKKNFAGSNRAIGFTVDVGLQNQNIFFNVGLNQTPGKATAETIDLLNKMGNQYGEKGGYTASVSLFNVYKTRSYTCDITMFGNVMIQPMMYFNLRHIPMFEGTYMIFDVQHDIRPGTFETKIQGIRQPIATLGNVTKQEAIIRIKSLFLDKISTKIQINANDGEAVKPNETPQTLQQANNQIINSYSGAKSPSANNDCGSSLYGDAQEFESGTAIKVSPSVADVCTIIGKTTENTNGRKVLLSLVWLKSANAVGKIECFNNNLIDLTLDIGVIDTIISNNPTRILSQFICVNVDKYQYPFAAFGSIDDAIYVAYAKFRQIVETQSPGTDLNEEQVLDLILEYWPQDQPVGDPTGSNRPGNQTIKQQDRPQYDEFLKRVQQAFQKGQSQNLWTSDLINPSPPVPPPTP